MAVKKLENIGSAEYIREEVLVSIRKHKSLILALDGLVRTMRLVKLNSVGSLLQAVYQDEDTRDIIVLSIPSNSPEDPDDPAYAEIITR